MVLSICVLLTSRISSLDHKAFDVTMKYTIVVVITATQSQEILKHM